MSNARGAATRAVGSDVPRKEGRAKVTGAALYVDDLTFPGMLHGRTIRSTVAKGEILWAQIKSRRSGLVVVDHRDIPGKNAIRLIEDDQPCLASRFVQHAEEPILLLACEDREQLLRAEVEVRYRRQRALFDPRRSRKVFKSIAIDKGDTERGFAEADVIVEGEYSTGLQEQLYIEPQGVIAVPENDGVTIYGSLQCPYYVHNALMPLLDLPPEKVRIVQTETGGGFGGKEEYPSMIAGHAALLALKAKRPVKLIYDRAEDIEATTKRHPSIVRHRTGVTKDGRVTAIDIDVLMDGGAYLTLSPVVLSRGVIHATGPYRCDHVRIRGRVVQTNTPPNGAFRGFGAPQTQFAAEVQMDRIAEQLGLDPVTIRERNLLRRGDTTATGQTLGADTSARLVLREALKRTDFKRRRRRAPAADGPIRRGVGLALFFHGSGFTGSGEKRLASRATLVLTRRGVRVHVGSTEIGQGTRTILAQIVADGVDLPYDAIEVADADTHDVPDSGPTVASRTCMIVGGILLRAAKAMRRKLRGATPAEYLKRHGPLTITEQYVQPPEIEWDEERYRGSAYGAYSWGCNVAEVEYDEETGEVKPTAFCAVLEIGRAVHPTLVRGQIEGGVVQGIGYALLEEVVMDEGRVRNAQMTNYIIPTTLDVPDIDVVVLERPAKNAPFGAKGVGESPIDGPAAAIVNALRHAGLDVRSIPATPERLLEAPCVSS